MAKRERQESEGVVKLNAKQRQLVALLFGAVMLLAAAIILISPPKSNGGALSQINQCESLQPLQRYYCIVSVANQTRNVSYCSYLSGSYQQQCVSALNANPQKGVSCNNLNHNSTLYQQCISSSALASLNATACANLSGAADYNCIMNISVREGFSNQQLCNGLSNGTYSARCNLAYTFRSALSQRNLFYCASLSNQTSTNLTTAMSLAIPNTTSINFAYALSLSPKDFCYYAMASSSANSLICSYVSQGSSGGCYAYSANALARPQPYQYNFNVSSPSIACSGGPLNASTCYIAYYTVQAMVHNSYTQCNGLSDGSRDTCLYDFATIEGNSIDCGYISSNTVQASCLSQVAATLRIGSVSLNSTTIPSTATTTASH